MRSFHLSVLRSLVEGPSLPSTEGGKEQDRAGAICPFGSTLWIESRSIDRSRGGPFKTQCDAEAIQPRTSAPPRALVVVRGAAIRRSKSLPLTETEQGVAGRQPAAQFLPSRSNGGWPLVESMGQPVNTGIESMPTQTPFSHSINPSHRSTGPQRHARAYAISGRRFPPPSNRSHLPPISRSLTLSLLEKSAPPRAGRRA